MISHRLPAILISLLAIVQSVLGTNPKREFRGAWVTTVYQEQYANQSTEQNKRYLRNLLDKLQDAGVNAILFQARPSADAFYESKYEPWSRYLTAWNTKILPIFLTVVSTILGLIPFMVGQWKESF